MTSSSSYTVDGHGLGAQAVAYAAQLIGIPYVYGGESLSGFDCSGLVQYVYDKLGVQLPRTSQQQASAGTAVSYADAQPGDLLIYSEPGEGADSHVGIYAGGGQQIEAPHTGADVRLDAVDLSHLTTVIRPAGVSSTTTASDASWLSDLLNGIAGGITADPFVPGSGSTGTGGSSGSSSGVLASLSNSIRSIALTGALASAAVALVVVGLWRGTTTPADEES